MDEASQFVKTDFFEILKGYLIQMKIEYGTLLSRAFIKPILEVWGFDFVFDMIVAVLSPSNNPILFRKEILRKIFQKFSIPI